LRSTDLDGTALEDHAALETAQPECGGDGRGDGVVEVPRREFTAPGVEFPIGDRDLPGLAVLDEDRSVIAAPDVVVRVIEKLDPLGHGLGPVAAGADRRVVRPWCVDADWLEAGDGSGNFGEFRLHQFALGPAPVARVVDRPRQPDSLLRSPFGGHEKSVGGVHGRGMG